MITRWRVRSGALLVVSVLVGCSPGTNESGGTAGGTSQGTNPPAASTGGVNIDFRSDPDPPKSGDNAIEVIVRQPDGTPVVDAAVTAVFSMPAMPAMNMPAMRAEATLTHVDGGLYRGMGQLSMAGTWNVMVTATQNGEPLARRSFSLVAR